MNSNRHLYERLYMLKDGKQDIYVDLYKPLPQHQIDGLRFLYRQFKKKTPGVILNDPSGYGKSVQTVLFLQAIRSILNKPILILCCKKDVQNWQEQFLKWTEFTDLSIQQSNPFAANLVHINTLDAAGPLARRSWAIVVVQDNTFHKDTFQKQFRADFKIWITSEDMKTNLTVFSSLYEWLHPNTKFNLKDVTPKGFDDVITKYILLDAFFEDIVLRRHDFWTPFMKPVAKPTSRKNKDPTGTKVKRSKIKKIESNEDEFIPTSLVNNETNRDNDPCKSIIKNTSETSQDNGKNETNDVENLIRDQNTIDPEQFKECNVNVNSESQNTQSHTFNEIQDAINDIIDNENRIEPNIDIDQTDLNVRTSKSPDMFTEMFTQHTFSIQAETLKTEKIDINTAVTITSNIENIDTGVLESQFLKKKGKSEENTDISDTQFLENKVKLEQNEVSDTQFLENKVQAEHKIVNNSAVDNVTPNVSTKSDTPKVKSEKPAFENDFDDQFAKCEENIMKKFKGSFLDTLF